MTVFRLTSLKKTLSPKKQSQSFLEGTLILVVDTMLVRDGNGAFLNTKFGEEQVDEFNAQMEECSDLVIKVEAFATQKAGFADAKTAIQTAFETEFGSVGFNVIA